ncbi:hypothetical protein GYMLUDRAFT_200305 [Collybiopsis luxurians FD-317 M1]|uniref:Uncharacterized protein n=1 Tax=Collybiopsis luxurians FD-317 M1 TaxID=944289 RepID=A0A0D0CX18_9AGAR|nr:hypothetical protein GYMLUDRAFT_200305 [Collybiopsis luxurians FD-317 M1]
MMDTDVDYSTLDLIEQVARLRLNDAKEKKKNDGATGTVVRIENLSATFVQLQGEGSVKGFSFPVPVDPSYTRAMSGYTVSPPICIADGWVTCHFDAQTSTSENMEAFISRWRPSRTTNINTNTNLTSDGLGVEWIAVNRGIGSSCDPGHPPLISEMKAAFEVLARSHRKDGNITLTVSALDELARRYGVRSGKWLVFVDEAEVDEAWRVIVRLVCVERGRGLAKVSVGKGLGQRRVICVYVDDFGDVEEVMGLREDLRRVGVVQRIGFKLDAYSHLGIYSRNGWGISPNRYFE